jgi:hypothetical protein
MCWKSLAKKAHTPPKWPTGVTLKIEKFAYVNHEVHKMKS